MRASVSGMLKVLMEGVLEEELTRPSAGKAASGEPTTGRATGTASIPGTWRRKSGS